MFLGKCQNIGRSVYLVQQAVTFHGWRGERNGAPATDAVGAFHGSRGRFVGCEMLKEHTAFDIFLKVEININFWKYSLLI